MIERQPETGPGAKGRHFVPDCSGHAVRQKPVFERIGSPPPQDVVDENGAHRALHLDLQGIAPQHAHKITTGS